MFYRVLWQQKNNGDGGGGACMRRLLFRYQALPQSPQGKVYTTAVLYELRTTRSYVLLHEVALCFCLSLFATPLSLLSRK